MGVPQLLQVTFVLPWPYSIGFTANWIIEFPEHKAAVTLTSSSMDRSTPSLRCASFLGTRATRSACREIREATRRMSRSAKI